MHILTTNTPNCTSAALKGRCTGQCRKQVSNREGLACCHPQHRWTHVSDCAEAGEQTSMSQMVQVVSMLEVPSLLGSVSFQSKDVSGAQNSLFLFCSSTWTQSWPIAMHSITITPVLHCDNTTRGCLEQHASCRLFMLLYKGDTGMMTKASDNRVMAGVRKQQLVAACVKKCTMAEQHL